MSAGWVAAGVRARGLARRVLGHGALMDLASSSTLESALETLSSSPYGREVRTDMDLVSAERAVSALALWHTRVLAGWCPAMGAGALRAMAAGFEVSNVTGHMARLGGAVVPEPYDLGSLAIAWSAVSRATTLGEVREALASSAWGDPGADEPAVIRLGLLLGWARRVLDDAPGAGEWAVSGAALVMCRVLAVGALPLLGAGALRDADLLLGSRWREASSPVDLGRHVPSGAQKALDGVGDESSLWRAETRWWWSLASSGASLAARPVLDAVPVVGVVGMLAADAWFTRAALEMSARGGGDLMEAIDAVA